MISWFNHEFHLLAKITLENVHYLHFNQIDLNILIRVMIIFTQCRLIHSKINILAENIRWTPKLLLCAKTPTSISILIHNTERINKIYLYVRWCTDCLFLYKYDVVLIRAYRLIILLLILDIETQFSNQNLRILNEPSWPPYIFMYIFFE